MKFKSASQISLLVLLTGCGAIRSGTVTRPLVIPERPSFSDSNTNGVSVANSGIPGMVDGKAIMTAHQVERFNLLVELLGHDFTPPLKTNDGVAYVGDYRDVKGVLWTNMYSMNKEGVLHFIKMTDMVRNPNPP